MTGDEADFIGRIRSLLPPNWFPTEPASAPFTVASGAISGYATVFAFIYSILAYVKLQTRIKTATDGWLDLIAYDYFGLRVQRAPGQSDASFLTTILSEIVRQRNTRASVIAILTQLTGRTPVVFEPWYDGAYLTDTAYYGITNWGSYPTAYQSFVIAYRGGGVSDAQIYAAVDSVRTAGTKIWVQIQN